MQSKKSPRSGPPLKRSQDDLLDAIVIGESDNSHTLKTRVTRERAKSAKIDGRTLRKKEQRVRTRDVQIAFRVGPATRQRLEDLAIRSGKTFTEIFEWGLELVEGELNLSASTS